MPQPFNNAIMTDGGARLLTRAQAGEIKIQFTRVAVGDGIYAEDEKTLEVLQKQSELKSLRNSYAISDIEVYNDYSVKVTALISNQEPATGEALITAGYYINEMGLYAKEKDGADETEVLYSIAVTSGENGDFMPPYNGYYPAQIIQDYFATVNNSADVTIQSSGAVALAEDLFEVRKELADLKRNGNAEGYNTETEYHAGEYCLYNNTLYKCVKDTQGAWDQECWEKTNPMDEIMGLRTSLDSLISLFGKDEEGNMRQLGEAAFAGIANNRTTTLPGFLADARQLKEIQDILDEQNSASSSGANIRAEIHKSTISFGDAFTGDASTYPIAALDDMVKNIKNYNNGIYSSTAADSRGTGIIFCKLNSGFEYYAGILIPKYIQDLPLMFSYSSGSYSVLQFSWCTVNQLEAES